ncbi:MAG: lipoprotein [Mobilitalea sp.]
MRKIILLLLLTLFLSGCSYLYCKGACGGKSFKDCNLQASCMDARWWKIWE